MTQTVHKSDQELRTTITDELTYAPNVDAAHLEVSVNDGAVTLSGAVGSLPQRHAAKRAAMRVRGVKAVADKIAVQHPGDSGPTDDDLVRAANQLLDWEVDVPANAVKASVQDHMITLTGNVTWKYQRAAASRAVSHLRGVTGVSNTVTLAQTTPASGAKAAAQASILRNAQLDPDTITVEVDDHTLTLGGHVRSWAEYREAESMAWAAAGVTSVSNDLLVIS